MKGVYIHIPFCIQKCRYCDFASYPCEYHKRYDYVDALLNEIKNFGKIEADTVYIGGGTPTCLDSDCLETLLKGLNSFIKIHKDAEFTIEANPATLDENKALLIKNYGVNRVSMGAQTFDDRMLKELGRAHKSDDIYKTYNLLRDVGFKNLSLDLMYALPNQKIENLSTCIDKVLDLNPEHISCYGLKYEKGTPLFKSLINGEVEEADEDTFADMYELIVRRMKENGYRHYEISNFAKEGMESRHNLKYWQGDDYVGFGTAASSCIGLRRYTHSPEIDDYLSGGVLSEDYTMLKKEAMSEFVILGLRLLKKGVDKREFEKRFSLKLDDVFKEQIANMSPYLINDDESLRLKESASLVSNSIMCEFMN